MITTDKTTILKKVTEIFRNEWPAETNGLLLEEDTPIFYEGIGLDSIDGATLLLAVEEEFDVEIEKEMLGQQHFETIGKLADFIIQVQSY